MENVSNETQELISYLVTDIARIANLIANFNQSCNSKIVLSNEKY